MPVPSFLLTVFRCGFKIDCIYKLPVYAYFHWRKFLPYSITGSAVQNSAYDRSFVFAATVNMDCPRY